MYSKSLERQNNNHSLPKNNYDACGVIYYIVHFLCNALLLFIFLLKFKIIDVAEIKFFFYLCSFFELISALLTLCCFDM